MIQTYENLKKLQENFDDLRERAEKQNLWPEEDFRYCCLAIQKSESYGASEGDPVGISSIKSGLLFLMTDRIYWVFPQKDKTFWTSGTTKHFSIQFSWKTVTYVGLVKADDSLSGLTGDNVLFKTNAGDRNFVLTGHPDSSDFVSLANEILMETLNGSAQPTVTSAPVDDIPAQIKKLADLRDAGILTDAEFESKKGDLLAKM